MIVMMVVIKILYHIAKMMEENVIFFKEIEENKVTANSFQKEKSYIHKKFVNFYGCSKISNNLQKN